MLKEPPALQAQFERRLADRPPAVHALVPDGQDSPGSSLAFQTLSQYLPKSPEKRLPISWDE